ncbi:MAG: hypothetical protein P4L33_09980 [Capsulimonadaceae bacterium]|nr:hypothetical protein [Capsulimonadaceae bacterium]
MISRVRDGSGADGAHQDIAPVESAQWATISLRAIVVSVILIPILVFWVEYTESVANGPDLAAMSLPMASTFALLVLVAVNLLLRKFAPRAAFSQLELLVIYSMNTLGVYIGGIGLMQFLHPALVGWSYFATPQNRWDQWFHFIRKWAVPDPSVIPEYYSGRSSFFTIPHLMGWAGAICVWSAFLFVLLFCLYCIATLMRRQWVDNERLTFPIVQVPMEITKDGGATALWTNRLFWAGAGIAIILETIATIHFTVAPNMPYFPIKPEKSLDLGQNFTTPPWNAMGYTTMAFYPLVIGLTYLLSLDVSFSCWFFYLLSKFEAVACTALGFRDASAGPALAQMPYTAQQGFGAFVGLALFSLWLGRKHLRGACRRALLNDRTVDDSDEPISYRTALVGLAVTAVLLIVFGAAMGLGVLTSAIFFALFFVLALAFTRIRAEAGLPWGQGPSGLSHGTMISLMGTESFSRQELTGFAFLQWFDADWRCQPQTIQLESMKMMGGGQRKAINPRALTAALGVAVVVGTIAAWGSCLGIYYHYGAASAAVNDWRTSLGHYPFDTLQNQLNTPKPMDAPKISGALTGLIVVTLLSVMRTQFVWWPLHPIGYAIGNTDTMTWIWFAVMLGWLAKSLILRFGGAGSYRNALPFFLGLVLGDYAISGLWSLYFVITGQPGYRTFPI